MLHHRPACRLSAARTLPAVPSARRLLPCSTARRCFATEAEPLAVSTLPEGVSKELIAAGGGAAVEVGQNVTVHCTGYGKNGNLEAPFWSTQLVPIHHVLRTA